MPLINVVRKEEQVKILKDLGAEHVLNSSEPNFEEELGKLTRKLNATVCFEAISGSATAMIMKAMPSHSISIVYGLLSEQSISDIDPLLLIGRNQRIEGFFLGHWLAGRSTWSLLGIMK
jgi:NADPH:quinone reductase